MTCEECKFEDRITALEKDSERNQTTHKEFFARFENMGKDQTRTAEQYSNIMTTMAEIKADVATLKDKPARRWETVVNSALQWIVVAILGAVVLFR